MPGLGWSDAVPFILIAVVMAVRGRGISGRPEPREVRPRVGSGQIRPWAAAAFVVVVAGLIGWVADPIYLGAITLTVCVGIVLLSSVVITGYAGQLSLCQFALAGIGADKHAEQGAAAALERVQHRHRLADASVEPGCLRPAGDDPPEVRDSKPAALLCQC